MDYRIMKSSILIVTILLFLSFPALAQEGDKSLAKADIQQGLYIFMLSKPVSDYDYLGSIHKKGLVWSGQPKEMLNIMIRRAKKEYPEADAIVITNIAMDMADVIKFKE